MTVSPFDRSRRFRGAGGVTGAAASAEHALGV
jgi:hypothetical protein